MSNKPTIPAVVADAIELARDERLDNESILEVRYGIYAELTRVSGAALRLTPFDTLLAALVNGYERELTEDEKRAQAERELLEDYRRHRDGCGRYDTTHEDEAYAAGMLNALEMVGVKIEGVNA